MNRLGILSRRRTRVALAGSLAPANVAREAANGFMGFGIE